MIEILEWVTFNVGLILLYMHSFYYLFGLSGSDYTHFSLHLYSGRLYLVAVDRAPDNMRI